MTVKQRARRDEDKAERVGAILAAAREVWAQSSWSDFSVGAVAERAGIVKGTIYIYFPTKEHLLLALYECLFHDYFDDVDRMLRTRRGRWSADGIAEAITAPVRKHSALLRLLPVPGGSAIATSRMTETAELLESRMPSLRNGGGLNFLLRANAMLTGLAALGFPDLESEFRESLAAMLHGMEKRK